MLTSTSRPDELGGPGRHPSGHQQCPFHGGGGAAAAHAPHRQHPQPLPAHQATWVSTSQPPLLNSCCCCCCCSLMCVCVSQTNSTFPLLLQDTQTKKRKTEVLALAHKDEGDRLNYFYIHEALLPVLCSLISVHEESLQFLVSIFCNWNTAMLGRSTRYWW